MAMPTRELTSMPISAGMQDNETLLMSLIRGRHFKGRYPLKNHPKGCKSTYKWAIYHYDNKKNEFRCIEARTDTSKRDTVGESRAISMVELCDILTGYRVMDVDPLAIPVNRSIIVSDYKILQPEHEITRIFSHWQEGMLYCFTEGDYSCTSHATANWEYWMITEGDLKGHSGRNIRIK